jgi:polyhydroxyalkanoate synthesis repressor PhaR
MAPDTILIKKYENRRLYDATNSRYVNLDDVAQILKNGQEVRVVDVATGQDITRLILTQIIVEDAKTADSGFPLDLLRQMIISSGRASQETALRYMKTMFDLYQDTYRAMSPAVNPFGFFRPGAAGPAPVPAASEQPVAVPAQAAAGRGSESQEVGDLKQRVAELERLVASVAPRKKPRKSVRRK